jgi:hypothetical protein
VVQRAVPLLSTPRATLSPMHPVVLPKAPPLHLWSRMRGCCGGCELPDAYKHGTTMRKRKRGRPKKTKPALTRQHGDFVPSDSDSEGEAPEPQSPQATEPELEANTGSPSVVQERPVRARKATAVHDV